MGVDLLCVRSLTSDIAFDYLYFDVCLMFLVRLLDRCVIMCPFVFIFARVSTHRFLTEFVCAFVYLFGPF